MANSKNKSAKGIPSRDLYGDLNKLKQNQLIDYFIQKHDAYKAGPHWDYRFGTPETSLYSFAVPKGVPKADERHLAIRQPLHRFSYGGWSGEIPKGKYGGGKVTSEDRGKLLLTKVSPNSLHFTVASKKNIERFALIQFSGKNWLMVNTTPGKNLGIEKINYTQVDANQMKNVLEKLKNPNVQEKIDGASSLIELLHDGAELTSYRKQKATGKPIVHSERFFNGKKKLNVRPEDVGSVLRGEVYGEQKGKVIPPQHLSGLLNSSLAKTVNDKKAQGIKLKALIYDIVRTKKKDMTSVPYSDRYQHLKNLVQRSLPSELFSVPAQVQNPVQAFSDIAKGKNPRTKEGLVIHSDNNNPIKVKAYPEQNVFITGTFPGQGKYKDLIGGLTYALESDGKSVGKVGTGFSDKDRQLFTNNPDIIGRQMRVRSQGPFGNKALRTPSYLGLVD